MKYKKVVPMVTDDAMECISVRNNSFEEFYANNNTVEPLLYDHPHNHIGVVV